MRRRPMRRHFQQTNFSCVRHTPWRFLSSLVSSIQKGKTRAAGPVRGAQLTQLPTATSKLGGGGGAWGEGGFKGLPVFLPLFV